MPQSDAQQHSKDYYKTSNRNERRVRGGRPQSSEDALLLRE